jgi:hypothetical protein
MLSMTSPTRWRFTPSSIVAEDAFIAEQIRSEGNLNKHFLILTSVITLFLGAFLLGSTAGLRAPVSLTSAVHSTGGGVSQEICTIQEPTTEDLPAYHSVPPNGPLPPTLDPEKFRDNKIAFIAYSIARNIPELLYQEPCYCHCDKFGNHQSLFDCYVAEHGVSCRACQQEVILIFEQSRLGKTPTQIREALARWQFWDIDLKKYAEAHFKDYERAPK